MASTDFRIGEALRRIRRDHRLSLCHVAEKAGISVATLSRVETNKQNVDVTLLLVLAKIFGVSVASILGDGDGDGRERDLDRATIIRHIEKLRPADRAKLLLRSPSADGQPLPETMDDLLATLDLLRAELVKVQRKVDRRRGRRG
jgi:transcriptional regulator with XRE-family HTH domain